MSIVLNQVNKLYGRQKALDNVSFTLHKGEITGFLGPNGAGKSTTMKIITGCLDDFEGEVKVCGKDIRKFPLQVKKCIGYLPEHNPLYPDMYIQEYLLHIANLYHIPQTRKHIKEIIELTGLGPETRKKIGQLSKGYRQRVGLAQALIHDPEILILDEPMTGLDPNQLEEIRNLIIQAGKDKTVLLSTHIMQEVEAICDRVIIINQGKIIADKPKEEIHTLSGHHLTLHVRFAAGTNTGWLRDTQLFETMDCFTPDSWILSTKGKEDPRIQLFKLAAAHKCPIIELRAEEYKLEEVFRQLTNQK